MTKYKLVPREPTERMIAKAISSTSYHHNLDAQWSRRKVNEYKYAHRWKAMWDAAEESEMGETLEELLARVKQVTDKWSPERWDEELKKQRESWVRGEMALAGYDRATTTRIMNEIKGEKKSLRLNPMATVPLTKPVLLLTDTGLISAWFHCGDEEDGPVWVCYDDTCQHEVEWTGENELDHHCHGWYDLNDIEFPDGYEIPGKDGMVKL